MERPTPLPVILAAECEEDENGDLICAGCGGNYADCDCLGPHDAEDRGYVLEIENGRLVAYPDPDQRDEDAEC